MATRLAGICLTAVLLVGTLATAAAAQSSQVSQYVQPAPDPTGPAQAGELPFTGLMVLPLLILGILVVMVGLALRRRLG
jgi:nucleoid-associated protein YgaU